MKMKTKKLAIVIALSTASGITLADEGARVFTYQNLIDSNQSVSSEVKQVTVDNSESVVTNSAVTSGNTVVNNVDAPSYADSTLKQDVSGSSQSASADVQNDETVYLNASIDSSAFNQTNVSNVVILSEEDAASILFQKAENNGSEEVLGQDATAVFNVDNGELSSVDNTSINVINNADVAVEGENAFNDVGFLDGNDGNPMVTVDVSDFDGLLNAESDTIEVTPGQYSVGNSQQANSSMTGNFLVVGDTTNTSSNYNNQFIGNVTGNNTRSTLIQYGSNNSQSATATINTTSTFRGNVTNSAINNFNIATNNVSGSQSVSLITGQSANNISQTNFAASIGGGTFNGNLTNTAQNSLNSVINNVSIRN